MNTTAIWITADHRTITDEAEISLNLSPDVALLLAKNLLAQLDTQHMPERVRTMFLGRYEVTEDRHISPSLKPRRVEE